MKGSFSLETILVFVGVTAFWVLIFSGISPQLRTVQNQLVEQELLGECMKVTNTIDTLATYGADTIYISMTPYFRQSMERGIYFCQEHSGCRCEKGVPPENGCSKTIFAARLNRTGAERTGTGRTGLGIDARVNCSTHIADWIDITTDGNEIFYCEKLEQLEHNLIGGNFTIQFGTYYEKPVEVENKKKLVRDCWE